MIEGTYPPVSIFYWVRSLFSIALSLLLILVGFVLWPVHDVLKDESYWWTLKSFSINGAGARLTFLFLTLLLRTKRCNLSSGGSAPFSALRYGRLLFLSS